MIKESSIHIRNRKENTLETKNISASALGGWRIRRCMLRCCVQRLRLKVCVLNNSNLVSHLAPSGSNFFLSFLFFFSKVILSQTGKKKLQMAAEVTAHLICLGFEITVCLNHLEVLEVDWLQRAKESDDVSNARHHCFTKPGVDLIKTRTEWLCYRHCCFNWSMRAIFGNWMSD